MVFKVLLILTLCIFGCVKGQRICEEGWTEFKDNYGGSMCILSVNNSLPWLQAKAFCEEKGSHLLNLDRADQFNPAQKGVISSLGGFIFTTFREFWSGLHLSNGRLMWDDYGPKLVVRSSYSNLPWSWKNGQPSNETGSCGNVTLGSTVAETPNGLVDSFNSQIDAELSRCESPLPFVCQKPAIFLDVAPLPICGEGWIGNPTFPNCFLFIKEVIPYQDALDKCIAMKGKLASVTTDIDRQFFTAVYNYYLNTQVQITTVRPELPITLWTDRIPDSLGCYRYDVEEGYVAVPCSTRLSSICTKAMEYPTGDDVQLEVKSSYLDQAELLSFPPFHFIPLTAISGRRIRENEVVFIRTPTAIFNSTYNFDQSFPSSNFDRRLTTRYDITWDNSAVQQHFNITLPSVSSTQVPVPSRRRRSLTDDVSGHLTSLIRKHRGVGSAVNTGVYGRERRQSDKQPYIDYDYIRYTTGYYTFGVYSIDPKRYVHTSPVLIRYAEPDMYIYVATCVLVDSFTDIGDQGQLSQEDINSFNMLQDESYVSILGEYAGGVLYSKPTQQFPSILYYRVTIERISNLLVSFRIFLSLENSRSWSPDMEQNMLTVVQEHWKSRLNDNAFKLDTLKIRSTVACPIQWLTQFDENEKAFTITLPPTRVGKTGYSWERCYQGNGAIASAVCSGGYDGGVMWEPVVFNSDCKMAPKLNESSSTVNLKNLSETSLDADNYLTVLIDTKNLTQPELNLTNADVIYTADILYHFWKLDIVTTDALAQVFDITNNILDTLPGVIDSAQTINNAANRIIRAVDDLTSQIRLFGSEVQRFSRSSVVGEVIQQLGGGDLIIGIDLTKTETPGIQNDSLASIATSGDVKLNNTDTAIYLPENLIRGIPSKLAFHIYGNTNLFSVVNGRFKINSKVAAAKLFKNDRPVYDLGDERVIAVFYPLENHDDIVCAYWNYSANEDAGGWNTEGCITKKGDGRIICECNHLTNFAVLIDLQAHTISETQKLVLSIITQVGLALSIIGLGLTILTFLVFKHLRSGRGQQVLINLSASMLCSSIVFLVGMERVESKVGCKIVAAVLHYFILVSFMWMLVEGLLQYLRFVKVLGTYIPNFMKKTMIPAWGIPLIPVIIVLAIDHELYYGGNGYCWMAHDAMLYAFIIPVAVIMFINIVIFIMVIANLLCRRKKGMQSNQSERKMAFLHFQAAISIFVILGLTWIFGFLAVDGAQIVFHYLFAIFNALQGFFIFLLFTVREKQIRNSWKKLCCKESPYKPTSTDSQPRKTSNAYTNSTGFSKRSDNNSTNGENMGLH